MLLRSSIYNSSFDIWGSRIGSPVQRSAQSFEVFYRQRLKIAIIHFSKYSETAFRQALARSAYFCLCEYDRVYLSMIVNWNVPESMAKGSSAGFT